MDAVRVCLLKALLPYRQNAGMACDKIAQIAFRSHVGCYLNSGVGFCQVITSLDNLHGLYKVYEVKDFFGEYSKQAWAQVEN